MKSAGNLVSGLLAGLGSPAAALFLYLYFAFPDASFVEMLHHFAEKHVLQHVISLSVLINLLLFFIFIRLQKDLSARGVLGATILYALLIAGLTVYFQRL